MIAWWATGFWSCLSLEVKAVLSGKKNLFIKRSRQPTGDKIANPFPRSAILFHNLPSSSERD